MRGFHDSVMNSPHSLFSLGAAVFNHPDHSSEYFSSFLHQEGLCPLGGNHPFSNLFGLVVQEVSERLKIKMAH